MKSTKSTNVKSNLQNQSTNETNSIIYWLALLFSVGFLFIAPFQKALFIGYNSTFDMAQYTAISISAVVLLFLSIYFFFNWRLESYRDAASLFVWLIPLSYLISLIPAASPHLAKNMLYTVIMYATFFVMGAYIVRNHVGSAVIQWSILLSGYLVTLYGIGTLFGLFYSQDSVMLTDQGLRLTSVFQYANAFAAFLMAILFSGLLMISKTSRKWLIFAHAFMIVPMMLSFLLTLSRGGYVVLPFIVLAILPFLGLVRQIMMILYLLIGSVGSLLITGKVTSNGEILAKKVIDSLQPDGSVTKLGLSDSLVMQSLLYVLLASAAVGVIVLLLQVYITPWLDSKLQKLTQKKYSSFLLPAAAIVVGILGAALLFDTGLKSILPQTLEKRVESINFQQHSVLERGTFYKDSIKLIKDYPVFGAGGGAWAALYEKYQNNPYTSRQTHNFFLQYLIEVGIFGALIFLILLAFVFYQFIRNFLRTKSDHLLIYYIVTISLLFHSIIDFEMSYAYLASLVFLSMGAMVTFSTDTKLPFAGKIRSWKYIYPGLLTVLSIFVFIVSIMGINSNKLYRSSISMANGGQPFNKVLEPLNEAIKLQPNNFEYLSLKINFLSQVFQQTKNDQYYNEMKNMIQEAKQIEPNNRIIIDAELNMYLMKQQLEPALEMAKKGIQEFPWDTATVDRPSYYDRLITIAFDLGSKARSENKTPLQDSYWKQSLDTYQTVLSKMKELENLPEGQLEGRPFVVTQSMALPLGEIHFIRGEYSAASDVLKKGIHAELNTPLDKMVARYYLASLRKQNQTDQPLFDSLIAKDPNEKTEIDKLASS